MVELTLCFRLNCWKIHSFEFVFFTRTINFWWFGFEAVDKTGKIGKIIDINDHKLRTAIDKEKYLEEYKELNILFEWEK